MFIVRATAKSPLLSLYTTLIRNNKSSNTHIHEHKQRKMSFLAKKKTFIHYNCATVAKTLCPHEEWDRVQGRVFDVVYAWLSCNFSYISIFFLLLMIRFASFFSLFHSYIKSSWFALYFRCVLLSICIRIVVLKPVCLC